MQNVNKTVHGESGSRIHEYAKVRLHQSVTDISLMNLLTSPNTCLIPGSVVILPSCFKNFKLIKVIKPERFECSAAR